ncbi:MAG: hypothetical protein ACM3PR_02770 [Bacteroidales bacterium]
MSIKKLLSTLFFFLLLLTLKGQYIEIRPSLGIGTYSMSKFKDLMQQSVDKSPFALKTTQNFPPYWFYHLDIVQYPDSQLGYGFTSGYYSTGARNHYADYSGSYREDIRVSSINVGFLVAQRKALGNNFYGAVELATGAKFSKIMFESEVIIMDENQLIDDEFKNLSWWVEPQVRVSRNITEKYALSLFAGYEFTVINNINIKALHTQYKGPAINWSGLRAGISMSYMYKQ